MGLKHTIPTAEAAFAAVRAAVEAHCSAADVAVVAAACDQLHALATRAADTRDDCGELRCAVRAAYGAIVGVLRRSPLGEPCLWPLDFWDGALGKLIYVAHHRAYGPELLRQNEVQAKLGLPSLARVAREQRELRLDYLEDPLARNNRKGRRRVSADMLADYIRDFVEDAADRRARPLPRRSYQPHNAS